MTFNPDQPDEHANKWISIKNLELDTPVLLEVIKVTPQEADDSKFSLDCKIHSGPMAGDDTIRIWLSRFKKETTTYRADFMQLCKAVLPDKWMVKPIHSFHFKDKVFWTTPKSLFGGSTLMLTTFQEASDELSSTVPAESLNETATF